VHQVDRFNRAQPALRAEQLKPAPSERGIARRLKPRAVEVWNRPVAVEPARQASPHPSPRCCDCAQHGPHAPGSWM